MAGSERRARASDRELRAALMQLTLGFQRSQVLFTATALGVFDALAAGARRVEEIAGRCRSASEPMRRLLNACCALDLVERDGAGYRNAPIAARFLAADAPRSLANWVRFMGHFYAPWGRMDEVLGDGRPVADGLARLIEGGDYTRHMILAMHEYAMGPGRDAIARLELPGCRRLLDVGGGPGSYAILLAERNPELQAVVFDLPPVVDIAREVVARHGLADRISTQAGNYHTDPWGDGYDAVLLSNMLHQEDPATCRRLLQKAAEALVDGGTVIVQLAFLNRDHAGPPWAALLSLQVLLFYRGGRTYSTEEILEMLPGAGLGAAEVKRASLVQVESLILATKGAPPLSRPSPEGTI